MKNVLKKKRLKNKNKSGKINKNENKFGKINKNEK